jgi:hypothetical protein
MPLDAPFRLGPFTVDQDGRLTPSTPERFPSFRVAWRGHVVQARLSAAGPKGGTLTLLVGLGRVPSTGRAEAPGTLPREAAFATVRALPGLLPAGWQAALLPDHRMVAETAINLALPTGAENLLTELSLFLLRLEPIFDLLAEDGSLEPVEAGSAAAAGERTSPG